MSHNILRRNHEQNWLESINLFFNVEEAAIPVWVPSTVSSHHVAAVCAFVKSECIKTASEFVGSTRVAPFIML